MKTLLTFAFTVLLASSTYSQIDQLYESPSPDHLFAGDGKSMVTVSTGIPYVGIAEYAYGVSSKTTIGFMYGQTPFVEGYGLRIRTIIAEPEDNLRVYFRAPIFYYPKTQSLGGEPWFLTWPALNLEYKRDCGRRMWAGIGAIGAVCANSLKHQIFGGHEEGEMEMGFEGGLWNTVQVGITQPISEHFVAQAEVGLVMSGLKVAGSDWVGGPPVVALVALTYAF